MSHLNETLSLMKKHSNFYFLRITMFRNFERKFQFWIGIFFFFLFLTLCFCNFGSNWILAHLFEFLSLLSLMIIFKRSENLLKKDYQKINNINFKELKVTEPYALKIVSIYNELKNRNIDINSFTHKALKEINLNQFKPVMLGIFNHPFFNIGIAFAIGCYINLLSGFWGQFIKNKHDLLIISFLFFMAIYIIYIATMIFSAIETKNKKLEKAKYILQYIKYLENKNK